MIQRSGDATIALGWSTSALWLVILGVVLFLETEMHQDLMELCLIVLVSEIR